MWRVPDLFAGVGVTYSFKNTRTMIAGLDSVQESREMIDGGSGFYGIMRASELVPYDSAIFISTDQVPQDTKLVQYAAITLLKKRIRVRTHFRNSPARKVSRLRTNFRLALPHLVRRCSVGRERDVERNRRHFGRSGHPIRRRDFPHHRRVARERRHGTGKFARLPFIPTQIRNQLSSLGDAFPPERHPRRPGARHSRQHDRIQSADQNRREHRAGDAHNAQR